MSGVSDFPHFGAFRLYPDHRAPSDRRPSEEVLRIQSINLSSAMQLEGLYRFVLFLDTRWIDPAPQVPESSLSSPQVCHDVGHSTTRLVSLTLRLLWYILTSSFELLMFK